jgi:hypothetical protein
MRRLTLVAVGLLWWLWPTSAFGLNTEWHANCPTNEATGAPRWTGVNDSNHTIKSRGQVACWNFSSAGGATNSPAFTITTETALIWYDPNTSGTGTNTSSVKIHMCIGGAMATGGAPQNTCIDTGGVLAGTTALTGVEGGSDVQNGGNRFAPGVYYIESVNPTDCGAAGAGFCTVWIRGEGVNP